jgi:hypothetical protein
MQNQIKITEIDLFRFVFFTDKLSNEKRELLENSKRFETEINFYNQLRVSMQTNLSFSVKQKLTEKIPAYKFDRIFDLHPQESKLTKRKNDVLVLAAASPDVQTGVTVKTFIDDEKNLLIKFLNFGDHSKVYIFSANDEVLTNFKVKFLPQNIEYILKNNTEPLRTEITSDPDLIRVEFNS